MSKIFDQVGDVGLFYKLLETEIDIGLVALTALFLLTVS